MSAHDDDALTDHDDAIGDELAEREPTSADWRGLIREAHDKGLGLPCGAPRDDGTGAPVPCQNPWPCSDHPMQRHPVSCAVRLVSRNPGHVRVAVFAGRNEGARGHSGELVFRADEWMELVDRPGSIKGGRLVIEFDVLD